MTNLRWKPQYVKFIVLFLSVCAPAVFLSGFAQQAQKEFIYAGTFSLRDSKGIYVYQVDRATGKLTEVQAVSDGRNPGFLAIHPNKKFLYAIYEKLADTSVANGSVVAYQIDQATGFLTRINSVSSNGRGPAHINIDPNGKFVYVANYGEGNFSVIRVMPDGGLGEATDIVKHEGSGPNPQRQQAPHVHSIFPSADGKFIYVSDLGIDRIMVYRVNGKTGKTSPAKVPYAQSTPGSGPRHLTIHPSRKFIFSAEELTSTVASYKVDPSSGAMTPLERVSMLPDDFKDKNSAADIHTSPDGKYLYASNRGHQSLAIYSVDPSSGKLQVVGYENTHGEHPRNFLMDNKGEYVFVANRDTDNITIFKRDANTGKLVFTGENKTPAVVCLKQLALK